VTKSAARCALGTGAPPLDLAAHAVREVVAGAETAVRDAVLTIDTARLQASVAGEPGLLGLRVAFARPGDPTRIVNVLDAVEPQVKAAPETTFPGALGDLALAGTGCTHRLEGVAVLPVTDFGAPYDLTTLDVYPDGDSFVDMAGPGAALTYWSATQNIVLHFDCDPEAPPAEADASIRRTTLRVARDLAAAAAAAPPDDLESLALPEVSAELPRVCVVLQVASEGPLVDTYLYGRALRGLVPTLLDPREVLDGALTAGQYDWAGTRDPTYFFQRSSLLRELLRRHGTDLCFCGVILTLGYLPSAFEKERSALLAAKLARQVGADAAVLTTFQTGNSHTDTMLTCRACERLGVRTVLLLAETNGGLTDHVPEADSVVSVGNEEELVAEWRPDCVIGGERTWAGRPADDAGPVQTVAYLGSLSQMGDMKLRAVSW
jgi:glycine reductase complex component B subunit alpha and beta